MELSCHCKNVIITVKVPSEVTECDCSICSRYMSLWGYYLPSDPKIEIGVAGVSSYSWGDNELNFFHCSNCGCITHYETKPGQSNPKIAVNFGMARKEVAEVSRRYFKGAEEL